MSGSIAFTDETVSRKIARSKESLELKLSNINFEVALDKTRHLSATDENKKFSGNDFYPSDGTLAKFAKLVYAKDGGAKIPASWQLLTTAKNKEDGYFGALYWNSTQNQLVIAHRGTSLKNPASIVADMKGIVRCCFTGQMASACSLAQIVLEARKELKFSISVTGHSLGGWLAQVCSYFLKTKDCHAHTVVFDSPGGKQILEKMQPNVGEGLLLNGLDITTYVSSPNVINTCNNHVGTLYRVYFDLKTKATSKATLSNFVDFVSYSSESHSMDAILSVFEEDGEIKAVQDWPCTNWLQKESKEGLISATRNSLVTVLSPMKKVFSKIPLNVSGKVKSTFSCFSEAPGIISDFIFAISKEEIDSYCKFARENNPDGSNFSFSEIFALQFQSHYNTYDVVADKMSLSFFDEKEVKFLKTYELLRDCTDISKLSALHDFLERKRLKCVMGALSQFVIHGNFVKKIETLATFQSYVKNLLRSWPELCEIMEEERKLVIPKLQNVPTNTKPTAQDQSRITQIFSFVGPEFTADDELEFNKITTDQAEIKVENGKKNTEVNQIYRAIGEGAEIGGLNVTGISHTQQPVTIQSEGTEIVNVNQEMIFLGANATVKGKIKFENMNFTQSGVSIKLQLDNRSSKGDDAKSSASAKKP